MNDLSRVVMCRKCFRSSSFSNWNASETLAADTCSVCATDSDVLGLVAP